MIEPYYQADRATLYLGDCIEVMRQLPEASVDAIVTDPPYGLEFMGKEWDSFGGARISSEADRDDPFALQRGGSLPFGGGGRGIAYHNGHAAMLAFQVWCEAWAREAYRVLKPGGHIAAFGGTRTHHRLVCGIEDAGFEIRDEADWMYGSGFPKSLDVSKAIDKAAGADREKVPATGGLTSNANLNDDGWSKIGQADPVMDSRVAVTTEAAQWQGWGTALKPAHEPICLARKPLIGNVAQNVITHGTGAINVDGCRIGTDDRMSFSRAAPFTDANGAQGRTWNPTSTPGIEREQSPLGRWPANVILDEEAAALLDATVGESVSRIGQPRGAASGDGWGMTATGAEYNDRGGPSRFFYVAKAARTEREAGLEDLPPALRTDGRPPEGPGADNPRLRVSERRNDHPTVKPVSLMRWLCKLITPPGGVVLDPFLGSGTTGMAALDEGFKFIGIDMTERYVEIARYRVTHRHVIDHEVRPANEALPQGRLL